MRKRLCWCALGLVMAAGPVSALETDQYWAWGRELADSTAAVNARFTLELERATADIEAALAENPRDRHLRLALAASYRREAAWSARLRNV